MELFANDVPFTENVLVEPAFKVMLPLTIRAPEPPVPGASVALLVSKPAIVPTPASVPVLTVVEPSYVFVPFNVNVPLPIFTRPPSVALSPATVECSNGCPIVILKPEVSTTASPLRTEAVSEAALAQNPALLNNGLSVPPLK